MKVDSLKPVFCNSLPKEKEEGVLYISEEYKVCIHLCACGCGEQTVLTINSPGEWQLTKNNGLISITPSIGNFAGQKPYHAHYYITNNKIIWC